MDNRVAVIVMKMWCTARAGGDAVRLRKCRCDGNAGAKKNVREHCRSSGVVGVMLMILTQLMRRRVPDRNIEAENRSRPAVDANEACGAQGGHGALDDATEKDVD